MKREMSISIAGLNVIMAFSLIISIATATIQITNYPNPFSPKTTDTTIAFYVYDEASVSATVYDLLGHEVRGIADGRYLSGEHRIKWNGTNGAGERVAKGGYILVLSFRYEDGRTEKVVRKIGVL